VGGFQLQEGGRFRGWLWKIARSKICDHHRREAGEAKAVGGSQAQTWLAQVPERWSEDSADRADQSEMTSLFHRAIPLIRAEFEDRTWDAFWRVAVEGHTTTDVAAELGISASGVRQAKSRVLRRLRAELGDFTG
jgi:RNA polymerase sigma-70 factor (ECF subfamily)